MSSEAFAYVGIAAQPALEALGRTTHARGPWLHLEDVEEDEASTLSETLDALVIHCVLQTTAGLVEIRALSKGKVVRELTKISDGAFWKERGAALPFELGPLLRKLRARTRDGGSVDPYDVVEAFLGFELKEPPKPKKVVVPRRKTKRGVVTMPGRADAPDADRFKPPAAWATAIDPRRGGWFREEPIAFDVSDAFEQLRASRGEGRFRGATPATTERFDAAVPALLSVKEEADTAILLRPYYDRLVDHRPPDSPLVLLWVALGGYGFAIDCVLEALEHPRSAALSSRGPGLSVLRTLRRLLAAASDEAYERARDECASRRPTEPHVPNRRTSVGDLRLRVVTTYLFPTEFEWVLDMVEALEATPVEPALAGLAHATRPSCPFDATMTFGEESFVHLPAMVEGFGRSFAAHLERELSYFSTRKVDLRMLGEALASIPTDEALQALARWKHLARISEQLAIATSSYPMRAARLGLV